MKRRIYMTLMWHPRDRRIPRGWRDAKAKPTHHDRYSRLIEKIDD